jgi:hypothetical protein
MSFTSTDNKIAYNTDGINDTFAFPYYFLATGDLSVYLDGTLLVEGVDYNVGTPSETGANVTTTSVYDSGSVLIIERVVDANQTQTDFNEGGEFNEEDVEKGLDRGQMTTQQIINRAVRIGISPTLSGPKDITFTPSTLIGIDAAGTAFQNYSNVLQVQDANFDSIQNYGNSLATAIATIGAANKTLVVDVANTVSTNETVPENIHLMYLRSGLTTIDAGKTLTINSHITAGLFKIFEGTGDVAINVNARRYPQWFGAVGDGVTDDTTAIIKAVASIGIYGATLFFTPGRYAVTDEIEIAKSGVIVKGAAMMGKQFVAAAYQASSIVIKGAIAGSVFKFAEVASFSSGGCGIQDISIIGDSRGYAVTAGIHIESADFFHMSNCQFFQIKGSAIKIERSVKSTFYAVDIAECGDTNKPSLMLASSSSSIHTQGSIFDGFKIEVGYLDAYFEIGQYDADNKFSNFGFEADNAIADTTKTYIDYDGTRCIFNNVTMNRNDGADPRVLVNTNATKSIFNNFTSAGAHGGDVFDLDGDQCEFSNISVTATATGTWAFDVAGNNHVFNGVFLNTTDGFNFGATGNDNLITGLRMTNTSGYTILTDAGSRNRLIEPFTDEGTSIASAATATLPVGHSYVIVTGTTNIDTINGGWGNRVVTLRGGAGANFNVNDATGNIQTPGASRNITQHDTITLIYDEPNATWYEVAYSQAST